MRNSLSIRVDCRSWLFSTRRLAEKKGCSRLYRQGALLLLLIVSLGITGCATSVGVKRNDPRETYAQINISAINADDYSRFSHDVLIRFNLLQAFHEIPSRFSPFSITRRKKITATICSLPWLNSIIISACAIGRTGSAGRTGTSLPRQSMPIFICWAKNGWTLPTPLNGDSGSPAICITAPWLKPWPMPTAISRLSPPRWNCRSVVSAFPLIPRNFHQEIELYEKFISTDRFGIRGLSRRNREAGMGAPFIAVEKKPEGAPMFRTSPGTLFLRFNCRLKEITAGTCAGSLEVYSAYDQTEIEVGDTENPSGAGCYGATGVYDRSTVCPEGGLK